MTLCVTNQRILAKKQKNFLTQRRREKIAEESIILFFSVLSFSLRTSALNFLAAAYLPRCVIPFRKPTWKPAIETSYKSLNVLLFSLWHKNISKS